MDDYPPAVRYHQCWVESDPPGTWGMACLRRSWDETEPVVTIYKEGAVTGEPDVELQVTLDEALDMSRKLRGLVMAERGSSDQATTHG